MLLQLDFLSEKPEFYINNSTRFTTQTGGFLSLITCCLIFAAALNFTIELLSKQNSTIIYNTNPSQNSTLNISNMPFMFMLQDKNFKPLTDEEILYTASANIWFAAPDNSSGITTMKTTYQEIEIERCDLNVNFAQYRTYFAEVPFLEHHYCPKLDANNITLYGVYGSITPYSYLELWIQRCINSTRTGKKRMCYSEDIINQNLETTYISYKFLDYSINNQNTTSPGMMYLRSEALPVSSTIYKRNWYTYKNVEYNLDTGLIFNAKTTVDFYQVSSPARETVDLRKEGQMPGSFAEVTISMDSVYDVYNRSFQKAQQTLANVGGITKGLIVVAMCLNYVVSKELYFMELIKSIFSEFYSKDFRDKNKRSSKLFASRITKQLKNFINDKNATKSIDFKKLNQINQENEKNKFSFYDNSSTLQFKMKQNDPTTSKINNLAKEDNLNFSQKEKILSYPDKFVSSNQKAKMNLSMAVTLNFTERIFPAICFSKPRRVKKIKNYLLVKSFIQSQICIKNLISKLNELEKLKHFTLSEDQLLIFENIDNPPFNHVNNLQKNKIESLWTDVIKRKGEIEEIPFAEILVNLQNKENKNDIDYNILNLMQHIAK